MRTSPLGMLRPRRRAPLLILSALALVTALGGACSDDDAGAEPTPTTTAPVTTDPGATTDPGDDGTTTAPDDDEPGTTESGTTAPDATPGDDAEVLTAGEAEAQLDALVTAYADALTATAASQALDERSLASFHAAFTGTRAQQELEGLQQAGVAVLNPAPVEVAVTEVDLEEAVARCASGTVVVEGLGAAVVPPVEVVQPYYFRLVPAAEGAAAPAWRLDFFNFSDNGVPLTEEAACG